MAQDLTLYDKTDPSSKLIVTSDKVTGVGLARNSGHTWLSKSFGAGAITETVGLSYICKSLSFSGSGFFINYVWSDVNKGVQQHHTDGDKYFDSVFSNFNFQCNYFDGTANHIDITAGFSGNVERLVNGSRSGQVFTVIIYNGITVGTGVLGILTVNAGEVPPDWEYNYTGANFNDGAASTITAYARTLEFTGLAGISVVPPAVFQGAVL